MALDRRVVPPTPSLRVMLAEVSSMISRLVSAGATAMAWVAAEAMGASSRR